MQAADGKLATRHVEQPAEGAEGAPGPKRARALRQAPTLLQEFRPADVSDVRVKSRLLAGKELCVISGNSEIGKHDLEKKIVQHGGKIVQHKGRARYNHASFP